MNLPPCPLPGREGGEGGEGAMNLPPYPLPGREGGEPLRWCLVVVLLLATALRFYGLDWDGGSGAHPDERHVVGVAESLRWPERLNPFNVAPDFAYGHLPLYLLALVGGLTRSTDLLLVGRTLAALFDVGTVALTFALGKRVYSEGVGLLAAAFVALTVLHVQQAHFYTADTLLAFFALGALVFAARLAERGYSREAWMAGIWAGLALGTKFSAALLALPLGVACTVLPGGTRIRWKRGLEGGGAALVAFVLTNPVVLLEFPTFWHNVVEQAAIARGALDVPYTRQFHATWPYLYPIVQQLGWGMGVVLGLAAFGGLAYGVWRAVREPPRRVEWVVLGWSVPTFAFAGALYARFPRYLLPLTPVLMVYAARMLVALQGRRRRGTGDAGALPESHRRETGGAGGGLPSTGTLPSTGSSGRCCLASFPIYSFLIYFVLISSLLHCLAFASLYRSPHPYLVASAWFYEHVPRGAVVAVEEWDHPLPLNATGYEVQALPVFDEDTPEKWAKMEEALAAADYVVVASQRGYATLARWPARYPRTAHYYRALFTRNLGFEPVACFGRNMRLGPLALADDPAVGLGFGLPEICRPQAPFVLYLGRLDESFVVYDHPQVMILGRRSTRMNADF